MPPAVSLDLDSALRVLPSTLHGAFVSSHLTRLQPHLEPLRAARRAERAARVAAGDTGEEKKKEKQPHVLLTEAEKKKNHIASEQKRRANIRKGYESLCALVPGLQGEEEEEEEENKGGTGGRSEAVVLHHCESSGSAVCRKSGRADGLVRVPKQR
jgi:hypothetical protein